ncbi:Arabinanase/levansucrase/invertase [Pholiota conissans]|uniref:Arabinanase/levansucrase/invertase n=1 Tax=Pholiota conissans TaxID=109636 RepID=A0A9P6CN43_9AGAR|nr:Arabinanase/levansucrase/invertase [Pholiota conissans]
MKLISSSLLISSLFLASYAQQSAYGQCGGIGWTGATTCVSGYVCTYSNPYYSQCIAGTASGTTTTTTKPATTSVPSSTSAAPSSTQTFSQPILWEDLADLDVIRVNSTYYYSASTMHYSPGAPILRSYDLVNWEFIGHSVPVLDWSSKYDLTNGQRAYVKGIWASSLKYRKSNGMFYWIGCIEFATTYVYTAPSIQGPWTKSGTINNCYYDAGLLVDDATDTLYVSYGSTDISVAQLSSDGLSQVRTQQVYASTVGTIEGSRMYKINGNYYILVDRPADAEFVLQSTSGTPWGPYAVKQLVVGAQSPINGGNPHQGGIVDTPSGNWYYMGFVDSYPGGRVPVLTPITWGSDGFPTAQLVNNQFTSYPYPSTPQTVKSLTGTDSFPSLPLSPEWEWNHNPDTTKFSASNGLHLQTATVSTADDLYAVRNTLTHRIIGPSSTATILIDYSSMHDGDRAGLALLRDQSAWIGIKRNNGAARLVMVSGINMNLTTLATSSLGSEIASVNVPLTGHISLRLTGDFRPSSTTNIGTFSYSTDGQTFKTLGSGFTMNKDWEFFMGYRFAMFNYATSALGGSVTISSFTLSTP